MKNYFKAMSRLWKLYLLAGMLSISVFQQEVQAQTLSLDLLGNIESYYRRKQLSGDDTSGLSFLIKPISLQSNNEFNRLLLQNSTGKVSLYLLPLAVQQQYNSHHPYGMNDNAMIQSKGYQAMISAGVYFKAGPLSIQLRPDFVYAANKNFDQLEKVDNHIYYAYPELVYNRIDLPSRFSDGNYQQASWGQSSIRLNFDPVSFGLSNENLWWGPGRKNSLLISNNAPGFKHLTLNTTRPVDVKIGKVEAQVIAGRLENSGVAIPSPETPSKFLVKPDNWRSIAGIVFTYQPKWVPGLYLGFDRTAVGYQSVADSAIIFSSWFGRFLLPESHAEVYFQIGKNRHTPVDGQGKLSSTAYIAGFSKLVPLRAEDQYIQVAVEFTQLERSRSRGVKDKPAWYTDVAIMHGYTNNGQVIGAGVGPGGSMQSLDLSWVKGVKQIGLGFERIANNNDFFYSAGKPVADPRRHWVDLALKGNFSWNFNRLIVNAEFAVVKSLNYQWQYVDDGSFYWDVPKIDVANFHSKIGLMYSF